MSIVSTHPTFCSHSPAIQSGCVMRPDTAMRTGVAMQTSIAKRTGVALRTSIAARTGTASRTGTALHWLGALFVLALAALTSGCGSSSRSFGEFGTGTTAGATLTSISVEPTNTSLPRGLTRQFTAMALYSDGTKLDVSSSVTWSSSATTIATINTTGVLTAVNVGSTTVSAASGTVTGSTTLTVSAATLVSIDVTPTSPQIAVGTPQQLTATGIYTDFSTQNLTATVTWTSSAPLIATVSNTGVITGLMAGTSTITATLGTASGSTPVTVTGAALASINVTPANTTAAKGTQTQFTATGVYNDGTRKNLTTFVTWTSTAATATISNVAGSQGLATAVAVGATTITATFAGVSGSTGFTITAATLVSIAVTPTAPSIAKGTTIQFTATGTYTDQSTQNLTAASVWNSATVTVATITNAPAAAGLASGVGVGTTVITATSAGITSAPVTLTVTPATLVSIAVTPTNPTLFVGGTLPFVATGTYSDTSTQIITTTVTWTSGTPSVATISNAAGSQGLATALAPGTTLITATDPATLITGSVLLTVTGACAYATNIGDNTISQYNIGVNGTLTPLATQAGPAPVIAAGQLPFSIAITPGNTFAYVANSNGNNVPNANTISQYAISPVDGSLSPLLTATVPTGINPNAVTLDPSATHLYATNFNYANPQNTPGTISQYTIGPDGSLTPIPGPLPVTGIEPASLAITTIAAGTFAYVANYSNGGTGTVSQYTIVGGILTPMTQPTVPAGAAPNFIIVDPTGHYAYVANQFSANISEYVIDQATGALTALIQTVAALPNMHSQPRFIAINKVGTRAYVADSSSDSVAQYTIVNGVLTPMNPDAVSTGAGSAPNGVTIDASGKYLYVADRGANAISQFVISPIDGSLAPLPPQPASNMVGAGMHPTSIATTH